jgi:hypothetical protein
MEIASLDQEQTKAVYKIASHASKKLFRITIAVILLGYFFILAILGLMNISLTSSENILVITMVQFAAFLAVPTIFLHCYLQKEQENFKLKLLEPALKSVSYVWRWFFIVSGIQLFVCMLFSIAINVLNLQRFQTFSEIIGIVVMMVACEIATGRVALHLLRTGEAYLEPITG